MKHGDLDGSRSAVWNAIADIAHAVDIVRGIQRIEVVEKPASGLVGLRWRETRLLFGKPATVEKWITEAVENESCTSRAEQNDFVFLTTMRIEEDRSSVTRISSHDAKPRGFVARLMSMPMGLSVVRR